MNKPTTDYTGGCFIENLMTEINMLMDTNEILSKENEQYEKVLHETQLALEGQRKVNVELSKKVTSLQQKLKKEEERVETYQGYLVLYHNLCDSYSKLAQVLRVENKEEQAPFGYYHGEY